MIKNYLVVAWRNLMRHKFYSFLNVIGLAAGIACALLAVLYVDYHFSFDQHHTNIDRIYKVMRQVTDTNGTRYSQFTKPVAPFLKREFPEIEHAVRLLARNMWVNHNEKGFNVPVAIADKEIVNVFTLSMVQGDVETGLVAPYSVFLSEKLAHNLFGENDPIGKTVSLDYKWIKGDYVVTGVFENAAETISSFMQFDFLTATFSDAPTSNGSSWKPSRWERWPTRDPVAPLVTYLLLRDGVDAQSLEDKLHTFAKKYHIEGSKETVDFTLQPLSRVHLYSLRDYGTAPTNHGDITRCYTLLGIGLLVLAIACMNYINLVTARSANRMREVGLRKVVGAARVQLMGQFLGESVLIILLACAFAFLLAEAALPFFNLALGSQLNLTDLDAVVAVLFVVSIVAGVGLLAGSYPALILSAFAPVSALKGTLATSGRGWFRHVMVIVQFGASVVLIIGTLVVYQQTDYVRHKDLGLEKDRVVAIPFVLRDRALRPKVPVIKQEILKHANVMGATGQGALPGLIGPSDMRTLYAKGGTEFKFCWLAVDTDFLTTMDIDLLDGAMLSFKQENSFRRVGENKWETSILINETAAKMVGWDQPVGKVFYSNEDRLAWKVEGVIRDFHNQSLHHDIAPQIYQYNHNLNHIMVRLGENDIAGSMVHIENVWKQFHPTRPFEFLFLNDHFDTFYRAEMTLSKVYGFFAGLSIFIGCLGMLGLVSYAAQQRTKEIGVRKVLGASASNLVMLLAKNFLVLAVVANVIAWPVAYMLAMSWLDHFAYRMNLEPTLFIITGLMTLFIVFLTVGSQAWRAVHANPVDSLRSE